MNKEKFIVAIEFFNDFKDAFSFKKDIKQQLLEIHQEN